MSLSPDVDYEALYVVARALLAECVTAFTTVAVTTQDTLDLRQRVQDHLDETS